MSEIVDRAAKAVRQRLLEKHRVILDETAETLVRTVIESIREPTETMHAAGNGEMDAMEAGNGNAFCEHIWYAMIDAALR